MWPARAAPSSGASTPSALFRTRSNRCRSSAPLPVVATSEDAQHRKIYDFGQNSAGYVSFTVKGEPGAKVVVEHSEVLDKDGNFYNQNLRSAEARLEYILKGGGEESYRPHFTFQGFRYARVTLSGKVDLVSIQSIPITSALKPSGTFTSSARW